MKIAKKRVVCTLICHQLQRLPASAYVDLVPVRCLYRFAACSVYGLAVIGTACLGTHFLLTLPGHILTYRYRCSACRVRAVSDTCRAPDCLIWTLSLLWSAARQGFYLALATNRRYPAARPRRQMQILPSKPCA